jgi:NAD(P)-dependent dehydrogenase (short-subunit alcohol dehydrogenase family)
MKCTPAGRAAKPADIAPIAVFLASKESGWLTGETIYATGGARSCTVIAHGQTVNHSRRGFA